MGERRVSFVERLIRREKKEERAVIG